MTDLEKAEAEVKRLKLEASKKKWDELRSLARQSKLRPLEARAIFRSLDKLARSPKLVLSSLEDWALLSLISARAKMAERKRGIIRWRPILDPMYPVFRYSNATDELREYWKGWNI